MAEKQNPWLDEGTRYDDDDRPKQKIRDMKFLDNSKHNVRVLPSKKAGEFPFYGYKQHWIPQNGSKTGKPITHGIEERCCVCEWLSIQWDEVHRLKEEEDMTDKSPEVIALLEKISKVSAKTRYDMNIIHREDLYQTNEETKEKTLAPKRMSAGAMIYKEIFNFAKKWGSPSNEDTGYDLEIETKGTSERREYSVLPDRNASPLTAEEKGLIEKGYDLASLRKRSTISEIKKYIENAKAPYNEIHVGGEEITRKDAKKKQDTAADVEKEIDEAVKPETKPETPKETKQETKVAEPEKKAEPEPKKEEPVAATSTEAVDDEHNIEVYECKGDFDENDKMCVDCPVKNSCQEVHPFYVKAKQLKLDIDPHRPTKDVVNEVKKAEEPQSAAPKRGKKIPF